LRLPRLLKEWLEDSEMNPREMTHGEIMGEARIVLEHALSSETWWGEDPDPRSVAALRRFVARG
jgi:hypothetical protein